MKNNDFDGPMLAEAYDRMLKDINASHILISVSDKASEKEKYNKALEKLEKSIIEEKVSFQKQLKSILMINQQ